LGASPFQSVIEAVIKPLEFAARDDFAAADRVRDLEATVAAAAERGRSLAIPRDARDVLAKLARSFAKPLEGEARSEAIRAALTRILPLADPAWAEQALARSPPCCRGWGRSGPPLWPGGAWAR